MKNTVIFSIILLIFSQFHILALSLWDNNIGERLVRARKYEIGEIIRIQIDEKNILSYKATLNNNKSGSLTITGGDVSDMFSFLPDASSKQNFSAANTDELIISSTISGVISEITPVGLLRINGKKEIQVDKNKETIEISGLVHPKSINESGVINSVDLTNSSITYTTGIGSDSLVLTSNDFQEIESDAGPGNSDAASKQVLELTDNKKTQLLLRYLNNLIDLLIK